MAKQLTSGGATTSKLSEKLPLLPLRDVVVYPHMVIPLFVGRKQSIKALETAMTESSTEKKVLLIAQKNPAEDSPTIEGFYQVGTIATILQLLELKDGTVKVLVEGSQRGKVKQFFQEKDYIAAEIEVVGIPPVEPDQEIEVLTRTILSQFEQYVKLNKKIPLEILSTLSSIDNPGRLADMIAAHLTLRIQEKQEILEIFPLKKRLERLLAFLESEIDLLQIQKRIRGRVKKQMERSQREYYLNEQVKAIQKELGESQGVTNELDDLAKRIEKAKMPKEVKDKSISELNKLKSMSPMAAEATVSRNYLDWIL